MGGADDRPGLRAQWFPAFAALVLVEMGHGGADANAGLDAEVDADLAEVAAGEAGTAKGALLAAVTETEDGQTGGVELSAKALGTDIPAGVGEGGPPAHADSSHPVFIFMVVRKGNRCIAAIERKAVMAAQRDVGTKVRCQQGIIKEVCT